MTFSPSLSLDDARQYTRGRVSKKRMAHIEGVVDVGDRLSKRLALSAEDRQRVLLACMLHDSCKEYKEKDLIAMALESGMALSPIELENGHLLHGPVAAHVIQKDLGVTDQEIVLAIAEHTLGNVPMTLISQIVFLADCLDETRPVDYTKPIWAALCPDGETTDLPNGMLKALDSSLEHVIATRRSIHPKTVDVRNYFLGIVKAAIT
jgi:predicted HD superfamily hydrolase involved in NAD metabolism